MQSMKSAMKKSMKKSAMKASMQKSMKKNAMKKSMKKSAKKSMKKSAKESESAEKATYWKKEVAKIPANVKGSAQIILHMERAEQYKKVTQGKPVYVTNLKKISKITDDGEMELVNYGGFIDWMQVPCVYHPPQTKISKITDDV